MTGNVKRPSDVASDVENFGRSMREKRKARGWSLEALAAEAFSNSTRKGYVSEIENGKIVGIKRETVRSIARALEMDAEEIPLSLRWPEAMEEAKNTNAIAQEIQADLKRLLAAEEARASQDQFAALAAELKRQSNLPSEVQHDREAARVAIAKEDFDKARAHLESAAKSTRQTAGYAIEEYARSLAALGALAFTALDFKEAKLQYGAAIMLPELSTGRVERYRRLYRIASNAVISRSASYAEGRKVLEEMIAAGVTPNEWT